jgi:hypothetical protein
MPNKAGYESGLLLRQNLWLTFVHGTFYGYARRRNVSSPICVIVLLAAMLFAHRLLQRAENRRRRMRARGSTEMGELL